MGRYGNIDGIATLTNNPNALDNVRGSIGYIYLKNQKKNNKHVRKTTKK